MITNREEIIDRAFGVFVRMNYEKASIITLARACGLTKTGIVYYFPHKLDLFMAVVDKSMCCKYTSRTTSLPLPPIRWRNLSGNTWRE